MKAFYSNPAKRKASTFPSWHRSGHSHIRPMQLRSLFLLAGLALAIPPIHAETPATDAVRAMVDAERKFHQTGQEQGTRAAFLAFLADDGIVFRPGPVNGKEVWSKRQETGLDLVWEPTFAVMAGSGDFGYDTGPAKWRASKSEEKFSGHGHFISVWKRQKDGLWKVALDCGIENPAPTGKTETLRTVVLGTEAGSKPDTAASRRALEEVQVGFIATAKLDFTKAFRQFGSDEVRLYRDGSFPAQGKETAVKLLGSEQAGVALEIVKGDMSGSGDLAYNYGKYSDTRPAKPVSGNFFQVWQTDAAGAWKLVLDWQQALPPQK
jgi:ketosteroid isomerase-like protein